MFEIKKPTKKLNEICASLGHQYSIDVIDGEQVIYRKINDFYDIEVSGLNNNRKTFKATIFVWRLKPGKQTVEIIDGLKSFQSLKSALDRLVEKYQSLDQ